MRRLGFIGFPEALIAGAASPQSTPYPYTPPPALNLPIQFGQVYGPANIQDSFNAAADVSFYWYPYYPVAGVWSGLDVPAYRLSQDTPVPANGCGPALCSTWMDWLYYNHPDWIMYLNDEKTVAYSFTAASFTGVISAASGATATGGITGATLTVTALATGALAPQQTLNGTGVAPCTSIVSQQSGTTGGVGVYTVSPSQSVTSGTSLTADTSTLTASAVSGTLAAGARCRPPSSRSHPRQVAAAGGTSSATMCQPVPTRWRRRPRS